MIAPRRVHHRGGGQQSRLPSIGALALLLAGGGRARAYDPATTHAGLTERAVMESSIHRVLTGPLGRGLGVLEPLRIDPRTLPADVGHALFERLEALDPAGGYRPDGDRSASALSWIVAGAVLAKTPPERGRNHFFDPRHRSGLDDAPGLTGLAHAVRLSLDTATSLRDVATGVAFDLTGQSSLDWIRSPRNDQSLPAFQDHWARAVSAAGPAEREAELVRGLVALGGILAVLQDAGEPAHVRNDFRGAFLDAHGPGAWNRVSVFERFVAARYGRSGVPRASGAVSRPDLDSYFSGADGQGLADRTQRRFFSAGTLPADAIVETTTTTRDVVLAARDSLAFPLPTVGRLELHDAGRGHHMVVDGRRTLAYVRVPGRVRFFLDSGVHADAAAALLPEIGRYSAGLIDHLLRARVILTVAEGRASLSLQGATGPIADARVEIFVEDASGRRKALAAPPARAAAAPGSGAPLAVFAWPAGAKKIAVLVRGADAAGPFVAAGELAAP